MNNRISVSTENLQETFANIIADMFDAVDSAALAQRNAKQTATQFGVYQSMAVANAANIARYASEAAVELGKLETLQLTARRMVDLLVPEAAQSNAHATLARVRYALNLVMDDTDRGEYFAKAQRSALRDLRYGYTLSRQIAAAMFVEQAGDFVDMPCPSCSGLSFADVLDGKNMPETRRVLVNEGVCTCQSCNAEFSQADVSQAVADTAALTAEVMPWVALTKNEIRVRFADYAKEAGVGYAWRAEPQARKDTKLSMLHKVVKLVAFAQGENFATAQFANFDKNAYNRFWKKGQ